MVSESWLATIIKEIYPYPQEGLFKDSSPGVVFITAPGCAVGIAVHEANKRKHNLRRVLGFVSHRHDTTSLEHNLGRDTIFRDLGCKIQFLGFKPTCAW